MATPAGLEPVTSAVTGRRSNQLSYGAIVLTCVRQQMYILLKFASHANFGVFRHSSPSDTMVGGGLAWIRSLCGQGGTGLTRRTAIRDSGGVLRAAHSVSITN